MKDRRHFDCLISDKIAYYVQINVLKYVDIKIFKTHAIFREKRHSRSSRNGTSVLKISYPQLLYAMCFIGIL